MNWSGGGSVSQYVVGAFSIGRNLAFLITTSSYSANNHSGGLQNGESPPGGYEGQTLKKLGLPTELMISAGQSFSANCGTYNIVVIPEAG